MIAYTDGQKLWLAVCGLGFTVVGLQWLWERTKPWRRR